VTRVRFEELCTASKPAATVRLLNLMFAQFDQMLTQRPSIYKVETVGSVYMAAAGLPFLHSAVPHPVRIFV
jgi:hypothetical protein